LLHVLSSRQEAAHVLRAFGGDPGFLNTLPDNRLPDPAGHREPS
jgi:hypothetical protein